MVETLRRQGAGYLAGFLIILGVAGWGPAHADPVLGRTLFQEKGCRLCHNIQNPGTVFKPVCPGLKGVRERHRREWLRRWLKDPAGVWAGQDRDVQDINRRFFEYRGRKPHPRESFMATVIGKTIILTDEEIRHLLDFLNTL